MSQFKIGFGYDSHRFLNAAEKERLQKQSQFQTETEFFSIDKPLIIGGIPVDSRSQQSYGPFKARSDGDVLIHAIVNAILSALADKKHRDIGCMFPNTDPQNSNRDSGDFLKKALELVANTSYTVSELKLTLKGKVRVDFEKIETHLVTFFHHNTEPPSIHIQGTSGEEMDDAGNGLGVEVFCLCILT